MGEKIIYLDREFREEFIDKIKSIAPNYTIKTDLTEEELPDVEISLG